MHHVLQSHLVQGHDWSRIGERIWMGYYRKIFSQDSSGTEGTATMRQEIWHAGYRTLHVTVFKCLQSLSISSFLASACINNDEKIIWDGKPQEELHTHTHTNQMIEWLLADSTHRLKWDLNHDTGLIYPTLKCWRRSSKCSHGVCTGLHLAA